MADNIIHRISGGISQSVRGPSKFLVKRLRQVKQRWDGRCKYCNNLSPIWHLDSRAYQRSRTLLHGTAFSDIVKGKASGCIYCNLVCAGILKFFPEIEHLDPLTCQSYITCHIWSGKPVTIEITNYEMLFPTHVGVLEIYKPTNLFRLFERYSSDNTAGLWPFLGVARDIPASAMSKQTSSFIDHCLRRCNQKHKKCGLPGPKAFPTRLIHVGKDPGDSICLIESKRINKDDLYIALSHCWGRTTCFTTTLSTICTRMKRINWDDLSVVFKDAIDIARRCQIQYIWIDSLCIIQDSIEDWEKEASAMANVYQNAYFTIAAVLSSDGSVSFLNYPREIVKSKEMELQGVATLADTVHLRQCESYHHTWSGEGPLTKRAWTFQEQVLSRRVIQFTAVEVIWQCVEESLCECTIEPSNGKIMVNTLGTSAFHQWHEFIEQYSRRDLTIESDRLPAIGGVASIMEIGRPSDYLAGLWRQNLAADLLWCRDYGTNLLANPLRCPKRKEPNSDIILGPPSWSWASIYGGVRVERGLITEITIISARCDLKKGSNPFGDVQGGVLTIEGQFFSAGVWCTHPWQNSAYCLVRSGSSRIMTPDCLLQSRSSSGSSSELGLAYRCPVILSGRKDSGEQENFEPVPIKLSMVQCILGGRNTLTGICYFLVVSHSLSSPGAFERLGHVDVPKYQAIEWLRGSKVGMMTLV